MLRARTPILVLALVLTACRQHPCGNVIDVMPEEMADLPLVHGGGEVCLADSGSELEGTRSAFASIMYWGDDTSELQDTYTVALEAAGWTSNDCGVAPKEKIERLCFHNAEQQLELHFEQTHTFQFAATFAAPSMRVDAFWTLHH